MPTQENITGQELSESALGICLEGESLSHIEGAVATADRHQSRRLIRPPANQHLSKSRTLGIGRDANHRSGASRNFRGRQMSSIAARLHTVSARSPPNRRVKQSSQKMPKRRRDREGSFATTSQPWHVKSGGTRLTRASAMRSVPIACQARQDHVTTRARLMSSQPKPTPAQQSCSTMLLCGCTARSSCRGVGTSRQAYQSLESTITTNQCNRTLNPDIGPAHRTPYDI
ncbi:hypothetical protein BKA58DRAFT_405501 [Alternaria rosae]|uniref:uncharacterized protein n=1 Tax=Alternaria rosae TaxID=1187941 RepID=UPI001E8ECFED|nr:uncharacterized protein BKA58DRAFT_405501 [Alternaria rosae]KAH6861062.1 hypothetical protein BKA58DRAFT_405501 [Alternaria rosae]